MLTISFYPLTLRDYSHIKELMKMSKCRVIVYLMGGQSLAGQRKYGKCPWPPPLDCTNIRCLQKDTPTNQHFHWVPMRSHLDTSHFETIGWLKVEDRVSQIHLCMVHRTVHGAVPKYLINYFNRERCSQLLHQGQLY